MVVGVGVDGKVIVGRTGGCCQVDGSNGAEGRNSSAKEGPELLEEDVGVDHILGADDQCQELEDKMPRRTKWTHHQEERMGIQRSIEAMREA